LNRIGYDLLERDRVSDAITVFQLNAEEYPKVANVYDSLAEAYAKAGNRRLAIENYKRSLELDLKNQNAIDHLKDLEKP
jgi:predicted Zn-dependent protease